LNTILTNNPVMRAELKHQQYVITTSRSGRFWIILAVLMLLPAFLASVVFTIEALIGVDITRNILGENGRQLLVLDLIIMNFALYVVMTLITMGLAANSISREQTGKTWETLLLTTLPARQIVMGKWWATLRALWGDHIMLALLRVGLISFVAVETADIFNTRPDIGFVVLGTLFVLAYTALEEAFSAALGLVTPLAGMGWVFFIVLFVRFGVTGLIIGLIAFINNLLLFAAPVHTVLASLIGLAVLAGMIWAALRVAELVARWAGAR
jgi:ABC-type transport system involved in multi-copper enzyme maturation permease subunit